MCLVSKKENSRNIIGVSDIFGFFSSKSSEICKEFGNFSKQYAFSGQILMKCNFYFFLKKLWQTSDRQMSEEINWRIIFGRMTSFVRVRFHNRIGTVS